MTLPLSGQISLGQVNDELNRPHTQIISLGSSSPRILGGKPSGTIALSDLRGKSRVNTATYYTDGLFTVPAGVTAIDFCLVAGGGGAGGVYGANEGSGGGGGGGVIIATGMTVTPNEVFTINIGAGGAVGANGSHSRFSKYETYLLGNTYFQAMGGGTGGIRTYTYTQVINENGDTAEVEGATTSGASGGSSGGNSGKDGSNGALSSQTPSIIQPGASGGWLRGGTFASLGYLGGASSENNHSGGGGGAGGNASNYVPGPGVYFEGVYVGAGGPGGRRWYDADPALGGYGQGGRGAYSPSAGSAGICIIRWAIS